MLFRIRAAINTLGVPLTGNRLFALLLRAGKPDLFGRNSLSTNNDRSCLTL